jgi:UDP-glucose 4-epimerase
MEQHAAKRFLVTGGAGFIGSHFCEHLLQHGHSVAVIDDFSTGSPDNVAHLKGNPNFHLARADIREGVVLDRLASQADVVVHLAAAVGVKLVVDSPVQTILTNVMGTEAVLLASHRYGCRVLIASTSEVYGKGAKIPFAEDDDVLLGPTSRSRWSYAASKMVDEFMALAYQSEYGLETVVFRLFNTVGPRQTGRYGMVIPRLVGQALAGEPLTVYGDGAQRRCFCDVRDVVEAIYGLALHPQSTGRVYNVGAVEEVSMMQLAQRIVALAGSRSPIVRVPYDQAYGPGFEDMQRRMPCTKRIADLLGWAPRRDLDSILRSVIAHFRAGATNEHPS